MHNSSSCRSLSIRPSHSQKFSYPASGIVSSSVPTALPPTG
nr:MAG TPA: hypothetical protein [Caudoviricetes sp.]